ncbi:hypothetical protein ABBQ32_000295 [Trebouxia sp. C0010 RCD-2024]
MVAGGCCLARLRALRSESHMPHRSERFWTRIGASKNASTLKVFQWNVLADGLAQHGDFVRVPQQALEWSFRQHLLLEEILKPKADIVCLQEVNTYENFFLPVLEKHGYSGAYFCKPCSPAEQYGAPCDGCALFYRSDRFSVCSQPLGHTYTSLHGEGGNQGMLRVCLLDKESSQVICVANTHLKAKAGLKNDAIRDNQAKQLLQDLQQAVTRLSVADLTANRSESAARQHEQGPPLVILCGDLNTTPDSTTCQLLRSHALALRSSWDTYPGGGNVASSAQLKQPFTTWKFRSSGESKRIIDYIWYSVDERLELTAHWELPDEESIGDDGKHE